MKRPVRAPWNAFARDERGAAMVEFSIIAFLLLVMVFGIVDFGRYFLVRANLTNAVRDGARYGAVLLCPSDTVMVRTHTRSMISWGPAVWKDSGTVAVSCQGTTPNRRVRVQIDNYPFKPATFFIIKSGTNMTRITNVRAEFRLEQQ